MSNARWYLLVAVGIVVAAVLSIALEATTAAQAVRAAPRWEHLALTVDAAAGAGDERTSQKIRQLGSEGWELVDVEGLLKAGSTDKLIYYFKKAN